MREAAIEACEQHGIVFITRSTGRQAREGYGADVSREGVQRDLLPLVEGSTVSTSTLGQTDHILFIASVCVPPRKPSDLIPEMQGRFPIRVELAALTKDDFVRILTEPTAAADHAVRRAAEDRGVSLSSPTTPSTASPNRRAKSKRQETSAPAPAHGARATLDT